MKKIISLTLIFLMLFTLIPLSVLNVDATEQTEDATRINTGNNIAYGKTYVTSKLHAMGDASTDYGYVEGNPIPYPDENGTSLTDGIIACGGDYNNIAWAGLHSRTPDAVEAGYTWITVDLGGIHEITSIVLYGAKDLFADVGVGTFKEVKFFDGEGKELGVAVPSECNAVTVTYTLEGNFEASVVEARIWSWHWSFVSEIAVIGSASNEEFETGGTNGTKITSVSPENYCNDVNRDATIRLKFNETIGGFNSNNIKLMKCNGWNGSHPVVCNEDVSVTVTVFKDANDPTVLCIKPNDPLEKYTFYYVSIKNYSILFLNNKYYGGLTNDIGAVPKYCFKTNLETVEYATLKWGEFSVKWDENLENMFQNDPSKASFAGTAEWKELAMLSGILSGLIYGDFYTRIETSLVEIGISSFAQFNEISGILQPGYIFAHKQIICGGQKKTLVFAVFRGSNDATDWLTTDASAWLGSINHIASNAYYNDFQRYLNENSISKNDSVFLVAGHSLGGGVANAFAWELTKDVGGKNVFAYTFASPLTNSETNTNTKVNNISNFVGVHDVVPHVGLGIAFIAKHYGQVYQVMTDANPVEAHNLDRYLKCVRDYIGIGDTLFLHSVLIQCPVDVELVDSNGNTVGKIIDNKVTDDTVVAACVIGDDKYFFYEGDEVYTIKLLGTDNGTMDYTIFTIDGQTEEIIASKAWTNVELYDGKTMIGEICPEIDNSVLMLEFDNEIVGEINQDGTETIYLTGDINGNDKIDMTDYILLKRAYFGTYNFNETQNKAGDINQNGKIDMTDYILLKRIYFGTYTLKK